MEWKINNAGAPLPINNANMQVIITSINIHHPIMLEGAHMNVAYKIKINGVYEVNGSMRINEGDQDAHTHLDELSIWSITHMVSNRLGIPTPV